MRKTLLLTLFMFLLSGSSFAQCTGTDAMGMASNIYTNILNEANPVTVDNDINSIIFLHRHNATQFGGNSGNLRYDISTNGGTSWTLNQGVLNPLSTSPARYPNVAIYNPPGNTVAANAYLTYAAATTGGTGWNGNVSGKRKLDGTGNTEVYNQLGSTQTLIPRSMVKGAPGVYWAIDAVYNGTTISAFSVYKGTWNVSTNDISWALNTTITPSFNTALNGTPSLADFQIAFDPSGQNGWVCVQTHVTPGPANYSLYPVFWKTTDGGNTWTFAGQVDLTQYSCITSNMATGNVPTTAFDMDLTVDVNGNPHCLTAIANGNNAYALFFTSWHAMFDVTLQDDVWVPIHIRDVYRGRGTWGVSPNEVTMDMEAQASRTDDGTRVFFAWADADSVVAAGVANNSPDLYAASYDVVNRTWAPAQNMTNCNTTWNNEILFPKMAENVLNITNGWRLPVVFADLAASGSAIDPTGFQYLNGLDIMATNFTQPQCSEVVNLAIGDTLRVCNQTSVTLDGGASRDQYLWSTGATSQTITVSTSGTYSVGVRTDCCTGSDSVVVIFENSPNTAFNSVVNGLSIAFTDQTSGAPSSWAWDFGDGTTSTMQNPSHTYSTNGTFTVCLVTTNSCGSDTSCSNITTSCNATSAAFTFADFGLTVSFTDQTPGTVNTWTWDFGDGNLSTNQSPTHNFPGPGNYNVCLIITDSCGADTTCQTVSLCPVGTADFSFITSADTAFFTDISTGNPTQWAWDFGDGNSSTSQNPVHIYTQSGSFNACLIMTDSCGSDTSCKNVDVIINSMQNDFASSLNVYPNPTRELINLSASNLEAGVLNVSIFDLSGKLLQEKSIDHKGGVFQETLNLRNISSGTYLLELRSDVGRVSKLIEKVK